MDRVVITEKNIEDANSRIPVTLKYTLAKYIAEFCIDKRQITIKENGQDSVALPDMAQRNTLRETQFKIGVFVKEYMDTDFEPVHDTDDKIIPYLMAADEADKWSDFETQLDRLKRNKAVADKCYEMLNDYHAFCRMVSIEIEQELQIKNDIVGRFAWLLKDLINTFSPEELKKSLDEIKDLQEQIEQKEE
ncbi:MAG: hypothetical protein J6S14_12120 [Clostridia bacterium]|nr:hypothetical protein [Clostridia bacterium]